MQNANFDRFIPIYAESNFRRRSRRYIRTELGRKGADHNPSKKECPAGIEKVTLSFAYCRICCTPVEGFVTVRVYTMPTNKLRMYGSYCYIA